MSGNSLRLAVTTAISGADRKAAAVVPRRDPRRWLLPFLVFVLAPTALAAVYYGAIAANLYYTELRFTVRSAGSEARQSLFGDMLSGFGSSQLSKEGAGIVDFLVSHDAVRLLDERIHLRDMLSRPEADFVMRLPHDASFDRMVRYYHTFVSAAHDNATGVTSVQIKAFRPGDAELIGRELMVLSEERVNDYNRRAQRDALRISREELARAEARLGEVGRKLTDFRLVREELNPAERSGAILQIISGLESQYAETAAKLGEMGSFMNPNSMQISALRRRLIALKEQISKEKQRLTGSGQSGYAQLLADYEQLLLQREIATKEYSSALASLEAARLEAQRQSTYITPVVAPHRPEEAEFPKRMENVLIVLFGSALIFGIGRLIVAGIRDHMMT